MPETSTLPRPDTEPGKTSSGEHRRPPRGVIRRHRLIASLAALAVAGGIFGGGFAVGKGKGEGDQKHADSAKIAAANRREAKAEQQTALANENSSIAINLRDLGYDHVNQVDQNGDKKIVVFKVKGTAGNVCVKGGVLNQQNNTVAIPIEGQTYNVTSHEKDADFADTYKHICDLLFTQNQPAQTTPSSAPGQG